ncbi:MAG: diguanylate cyclase [Gammaproteobacteria bacterium]|nr:diguanylate cyclase [Gammaproteobacteria bacterium]MDH5592989.1 diguanylate cyclase [Gammaproteobacteria bacterium]
MNNSNQDYKIHVLLVDDQEMIAKGIEQMLKSEQDIELHYTSDPKTAVQMAIDVKATIILQDLVMPNADGMILLRFYRAHVATKNIPVIVLSSKENPKVKSNAFSNGATDYLVKLPDKVELIARIRAHSKSYMAQLERDAAYYALSETQKELEKSNKELQRLSSMDGLTKIPNRRTFDESLDKEWRNAARGHKQLSLIMLDIDHFKKYNDGYGHQGGDDCLVKVAQALHASTDRPMDIVCRYGGEEFAAILPDTPIEGARIVAEKMLENVANLKLKHEFSDTADIVSVSMGAASCFPGDDMKPEDLITKADAALYVAKESGRNRVHCHEPDK